MSYSLNRSNPLIDLCADRINALGPRHSLVYNHSQVLKRIRPINSSGIYFKRHVIYQFKHRELPKVTKLHLEIFRVSRLLENQLEIVAKSEFNWLSRSNMSADE